jgi:hypothetical protein
MTEFPAENRTAEPRLQGRDVTVRSDDIFVVSYPRSGSTWMRFLLANLMSAGSDEVSFANIEGLVPDIYVVPDEELSKLPSPRMMKSHEVFDPRYRRVIYLVRDPRDVAASYLAYLQKMKYFTTDPSVEAFVERFIAGELDSFGNWRQNVGSWIGARGGDDDFLLVRYEDLRSNPIGELDRVAAFAELEIAPERLAHAVSASDIAVMRRLERETGQLWRPLRGSRTDIDFVRHGRIGGAKQELTPDAVEVIESVWPRSMLRLGYRVGESRWYTDDLSRRHRSARRRRFPWRLSASRDVPNI